MTMHDVGYAEGADSRSGIIALLCTLHRLVTDNGRTPLASVRHEEADAWERGRHTPVRWVSGSEARGLRTHRRSGRSRPLRSAVVEKQAPSCSSGLTPNLREDWSRKRALETPCHARIATSSQDTAGHVSGPAKPKVTWGTKFPADV